MMRWDDGSKSKLRDQANNCKEEERKEERKKRVTE
jgi:hypothetical protein